MSPIAHGDAYGHTFHTTLGYGVMTCMGCLLHIHVLEDA